MQVNFRYSDTDFIAYLITLGYQYNKIEIIRDRNKQLKAFVYFIGEKDDLLQIQEEFKNGLVSVNILEFIRNRKIMVKLIKTAILQYQAKNM